MTITAADWRATYPATAFTPAQLRSILFGHLNIGLGPMLVTTSSPPPWVIEDPRVSPQSIIIPVPHDDEAAKVIAAGWWVDLTVAGQMTFNSVKNTLVKDITISFGIIG